MLCAASAMAVILSCICATPPQAKEPDELVYLTEDYYPFNYVEEKRVVGIMPDLIREMWSVMGVEEQEFHIYPWARAYEMIQNELDTVLFSMSRTKEREPLFKWVGPITVDRFMLFARKDRHPSAFTLNDLKGADVGTVRDDIGDQAMAALGTKAKIRPVADVNINLRKIMNNRIDYMVHDEVSMRMLLRRHQLPEDALVPVYLVRKVASHIAVSRNVPDELIHRMNDALYKVRNSPAYDRIFEKYMH